MNNITKVWGLTMYVMTLSACSLGWLLSPQVKFASSPAVEAPDYHSAEAWAALPETPGKTIFSPAKISDYPLSEAHRADVFFVHPTAWFSRKQWNADFSPGASREVVDHISMASQASVFNACCRIFAPRHRQATLGAFYAEIAEAEPAFDIAYQDLRNAFIYFLQRNGERPFFLAGHSQGSLHLMRLLENEVNPYPEIRQRMVAAYLPGAAIPVSWYSSSQANVPCETPEQTGCVAAWDTYEINAKVQGHEPVYHWQNNRLVRYPVQAARQCTNPLNWSTDFEKAPQSQHLGAVQMINRGKDFNFSQLIFSERPLEVNITGLAAPRVNLTSATCDTQALRVENLKQYNYPVMETQPGNYHLLDYELFWMNLRHNSLVRLRHWWQKH